jgi:hypothetical protein
MEIFLRNFNANVRRGYICKPTIGNDSLYETSNIGVSAVNDATSKKLLIKSPTSQNSRLRFDRWKTTMKYT